MKKSGSNSKPVAVSCPVLRLPDDMVKKRPQQSSNSFAGRKRSRVTEVTSQAIREELSGLYTEIKDLSASTYTGLKGKRYKEDKLTKLGAPPPKEQKMPFAMKMGILQGRKRREEATVRYAKEAGVVLAKSKKPSANQDKKGSKKSRDDFEVRTKGGILNVNPSKFSGKRGKR